MTVRKLIRIFLWGVVPLAVLVVTSVAIGFALMPPPPPPDPIVETRAPELVPSPDGAPAILRIEFKEGQLELVPAAAGEPLQIEAEYDASSYQLDTDTSSRGGRQMLEVRFGPSATRTSRLAQMRQVIRDRGGDSARGGSRIIIHVPVDLELDLETVVRRADAKLDLTGMSLRSFDGDVKMGALDVAFKSPSPVELDRFKLRGRMCDARVVGLGQTGVRDVNVRGMMGSFEVGLKGDRADGARVAMRVRLGDGRVAVPEEIPIRYGGPGARMGDVTTPPATPAGGSALEPRAEPGLHGIDLALDVMFGSIEVDRLGPTGLEVQRVELEP